MKYKFLTVFVTVLSISGFAQDMRRNSASSLFSDQKASQVGDAVTIIVMESSQASNNAETNSGRTSDLGLNGEFQVGTATGQGGSASAGTKNQFSGSGSTKTTGLIRTRISAMIDSVLPNGNLHIKGSRKIVINGEEQTINIRGIVRTADISAENSVESSNISEAEIAFEGSGIINDSQKPGWLTKLFHWLF